MDLESGYDRHVVRQDGNHAFAGLLRNAVDLPENVFSVLSEVTVDVVRDAAGQVFDGGGQKRNIVRIRGVTTRIPQFSLQKHA